MGYPAVRTSRPDLDAGLALLAEQGFARMTLDGVTWAAGVSKATTRLRYRTEAAPAAAAVAALRPYSTPPPTAGLHAELAATPPTSPGRRAATTA